MTKPLHANSFVFYRKRKNKVFAYLLHAKSHIFDEDI